MEIFLSSMKYLTTFSYLDTRIAACLSIQILVDVHIENAKLTFET